MAITHQRRGAFGLGAAADLRPSDGIDITAYGPGIVLLDEAGDETVSLGWRSAANPVDANSAASLKSQVEWRRCDFLIHSCVETVSAGYQSLSNLKKLGASKHIGDV